MTKYYGEIGYCETKTSVTKPGVWQEEVVAKRKYSGE